MPQAPKHNQNQTPQHPNQKTHKGPNRHFSRDDMQMANKHRKRCPVSPATRETNLTHNKHHFTPIRMATLKSKQKTEKDVDRKVKNGNSYLLLVEK